MSAYTDTVYNGSKRCPDCGRIMNPIEAIYGYGLCPDCQAYRNAQLVKGRMNG